MRLANRRAFGALVAMIMLAVSACGESTGDSYSSDTTPPVPETPEATAENQVLGPEDPEVVFRAPVSYLEDLTPPCVPLEGSSHDPCAPTTPQRVAVLSAPASLPLWPTRDDPPTVSDAIMGWDPQTIIHIVVRATVQEDTTRCGLYPLVFVDYAGRTPSSSTYRYNCYADVRVNEYIVGTGPAELTVELHREGLILNDEMLDDWDNWKDNWLTNTVRDPEGRTAAVYESNEVVLLLEPSFTIAVEAWLASGTARVWFVQQPDDDSPVRAVASDIDYARTEEQRNNLDMLLTDLVTKLKAAATARDDEYDGRIGEDTDLPDLIDDANNLRDFFVESGAVYRGPDKTTELPPPVGGPPETPTNVALEQEGDRWLVTWDPAETGGDAYHYYLWLESTLADGTTKSFYNSKSYEAETEFEITYMAAYFGIEFTVQVRAWNSGGYSDWTAVSTFTTPSSS